MAMNILAEYEASIVATALLRASSIPQIDLSPDEFTDERLGHIFRVIRDKFAASEATDAVSVGEALIAEGKTHLATHALQLASTGHFTDNPANHAGAIRRHAQMRNATDIARNLLAASQNRKDGCIDSAIAALMDLNRGESKHEFTGKQAANAAFKEVNAAHAAGDVLRGITTGIDRLDYRLGGWHRSDLNIVGARPSVGKTALLLNFARAALGANHCVGLISAEQPMVQIGQRHIAMSGNIHADRLRSGKLDEEDWAKLTTGSMALAGSRYFIYDRSNPSFSEVARVARKWKHAHGLDILLVDYIQRIRSDNDNAARWERVGDVARNLKNLARDLDIPVVALAQVGRDVEKRTDQRPRMGDLSDSSELEKEADTILMVYRDEVARADANDCERGVMELLLEKNRHGPTGKVKVHFAKETMRVENLEGE
jgi:replicative DNA helicase